MGTATCIDRKYLYFTLLNILRLSIISYNGPKRIKISKSQLK